MAKVEEWNSEDKGEIISKIHKAAMTTIDGRLEENMVEEPTAEEIQLLGEGLKHQETFDKSARALILILKDKDENHWARRMLAKHLSVVEKSVRKDNPNLLRALELVAEINVAYGKEKHQYQGHAWTRVVHDLMRRNKETILSYFSDQENISENELFRRVRIIPRFANALLEEYGKIEELYLDYFAQVFWIGLTETPRMGGPALYSIENFKEANDYLFQLKSLTKLMPHLFGINPEDLDVKQYLSGFATSLLEGKNFAQDLLYELAAMRTLEKRRPGSVKALFEQRGIRYFSRYDKDFLLRQYNELNQQGPSLVVSHALFDRNRSFWGKEQQVLLEDWERQARALGLKIRLVEWENPYDLSSHFSRLHKMSGGNTNGSAIRIHILRGHGHERHIAGGATDSSEFHSRRDAADSELKNIADSLSPSCVTIVETCYAGAELGAWLSTFFGKVITPPSMTAAIKKIDFAKHGENLEPRVLYAVGEQYDSPEKEHSGYMFKNGKRIKQL